MGYSNSKSVIERAKEYLEILLVSNQDVTWQAENTHMFAYYLREAMTLAAKHRIAPYHELKGKWIIRNKGNRVVAELKGIEPLVGLQAMPTKFTSSVITTLTELVGAAITVKATEMYFSSVALSDADKLMLYQWCQKNEYYMVAAEVGVTLLKNDPGDVAWQPEST